MAKIALLSLLLIANQSFAYKWGFVSEYLIKDSIGFSAFNFDEFVKQYASVIPTEVLNDYSYNEIQVFEKRAYDCKECKTAECASGDTTIVTLLKRLTIKSLKSDYIVLSIWHNVIGYAFQNNSRIESYQKARVDKSSKPDVVMIFILDSGSLVQVVPEFLPSHFLHFGELQKRYKQVDLK